MKDKIKMTNRLIFSINPKKYVYLYKEKISKAFLYVIVLSLIIGVIQGAMTTVIISKLEKTTKMILSQDEVQFEMKDGILDFKSSPIKEEEGQALLYIDTDQGVEDLESLRNITVHKDMVTAILKDGFMVKVGSENITYKYSDLGLDKVDLDNNFVISVLQKVGIIKYIVIPIMIVVNFIQIIIYALLISLVGLLSNLITNRKIGYGKVFNLSLYAVTLPAIINLIYPIGGYSILVGGIILMLGLNYISFYNENSNIESN